MPSLFREADLPVDDTPVVDPSPGRVPETSGRKRFYPPPLTEEQKFRARLAGNAARYGITEERVWELVEAQDHGCAICSAAIKPGGRKMAVDHNHRTGEVRGILCIKCNLALGTFQDSPYILKAAVRYLAERGHYGPDIPDE